jgi:putative salt-induced outer membrane protein
VRNAESSRFNVQSDYTFSNNNYAFAAFDTQYDRFGPYLRRTSSTSGVIDTPSQGLDVQAGVGSSWTRRPGEAVVQEGVLAGTLRYEWKISPQAALSERLNVEARSANTFSESITALTANIKGALAMSLSYSIRHNTVVPPDRRKNDTATTVSLIYGF